MGMRHVLAGAAVAGLLSASAAAHAETFEYAAVMHVSEAHSFAVLGDPAHRVGIAKFRGLALIDGEGPVIHRYEGWFDTVDGTGDFRGTALWVFPDGELTAHYDGTLEGVSADDFEFRATLHDFSGTGAYEGSSGAGSFAGRRMEEISEGGSTYLEGSFTLDHPR